METIELGVLDLALAAVLILVHAGLDVALKLSLGKDILLAAVRAVVQLTLLGFVLGWVFGADQAWIVVALMIGMAVLAGNEAVRRTRFRAPGLRSLAITVVLASSMLVTLYATQFVLSVSPWYDPRYMIPILGMVLGNALNGVSLGLESTLDGLVQGRERIELLLAHGATPWQAGKDVTRRAVRTGLIPILNAMVAAGVISVPGMMTGQILSGEDPGSAARYQVFILFCIAGGVALGTLGVVLGASRMAFDERMRLRSDAIERMD